MNLKRPPVAVDGTARGAQVQPRIAKVGEDERIGGPQFERPPVSLDRLAGPEFAQEIARPDVAPNQRRGEFHRALQMAKRLRQLAGLGQRGAKQQVGIGIVGRKLDTAPKTSHHLGSFNVQVYLTAHRSLSKLSFTGNLPDAPVAPDVKRAIRDGRRTLDHLAQVHLAGDASLWR